MTSRRFESIQKVLSAMKRAETARLQAKVSEVHTARRTATELRENSAAQETMDTPADMLAQSRHQQSDEKRARDLDVAAQIAEQEAAEMRKHLATTLGREQAADLLAANAASHERATRERRAETVPLPGNGYASGSSGPSGVSSEGTE